MSEGILTPTATREALDRLGIKPNRNLGQNFLIDGNIVRKSLQFADVSDRDIAIEIGPGLGTLTLALLARGAIVYAVEIDRTLHRHLNDTIPQKYPNRFFSVLGDAVKNPLAGYPPNRIVGAGTTDCLPLNVKVVANLPYAVATPWLGRILSGPLPSRLCIMVQKEAADRYLAVPGGKSFSAITIFLQSAYDTVGAHAVSRSCFTPKPAVDSVLLNLVRRRSVFRFSGEGQATIRRLFAHRRKQIGALARGRADLQPWLELLRRAGFDQKVRPERIPVTLWTDLERTLRES